MIDHTVKNAEIVLKGCQERNEPFVYWDRQEVDKLDFLPFPYLETAPKGWTATRSILVVNLDDKADVLRYKGLVKLLIKEYEGTLEEIGFAITYRNENEVTVRAFRVGALI